MIRADKNCASAEYPKKVMPKSKKMVANKPEDFVSAEATKFVFNLRLLFLKEENATGKQPKTQALFGKPSYLRVLRERKKTKKLFSAPFFQDYNQRTLVAEKTSRNHTCYEFRKTQKKKASLYQKNRKMRYRQNWEISFVEKLLKAHPNNNKALLNTEQRPKKPTLE